VLVVVATRRT